MRGGFALLLDFSSILVSLASEDRRLRFVIAADI